MARVTKRESAHHGTGSSHSGSMSGDSPEVTPTGLNLVGMNLINSLNDMDDLKSVAKIKDIPVPSPASTHASRTSSQASFRTSEGDTTDSLNDKPFNRLAVAQGYVKWVDSPIRRRSDLPQCEADQNKQCVEYPIRPCGDMQGFAGHQSEHQPFMDPEAITTPTPACTVPPVQPCVVYQFNPSNGMVEYVKQQDVTWFCVTCDPGVLMRSSPHFEAQWTGGMLAKNEVFSVDHEIVDPSGRIYLHLTDGRGWAFDDSALAPQSPSVVRMDFGPVSHPPILCHTAQGLTTPNTHQTRASFCVRCNYQMEAGAKFCCQCGKNQQPPSVAAPGHEPSTQ